MALELLSYVQNYRTVYNPIEFVLYENNNTKRGYKGFRYLVDVYDGATLLGRLEVPLNPTQYGRADVHGICESYITSNLGAIGSTVAFVDNAESWKVFTFKFGEYYFDGANWVTDAAMSYLKDDESETSEVIVIFNGSLPNYRGTVVNFYDWQTTDYYENYTVSATDRKWLSNAPLGNYRGNEDTTKVELTDEGWLYFLYDDDSNLADSIIVVQYDNTAMSTTTKTIPMSPVPPPGVTGKHLRVPCAPASLNTVLAGTVTAGNDTYRVTLYNGVTQVSESRYFKPTSECRYEKRRLEYLNSLGGFDYFNFTKVSRMSEDIERKFFKQNQDNLKALGVIEYSISDREKVQYHTVSRPKMKLTSDWVSVDIFNNLLELLSSPEVYLHEANNVTGAIQRIPIQNIDGNWQQKLSTVDTVFNLEITLEFGMDNIRQRW